MTFKVSNLLQRGSGVWPVIGPSWSQPLTSATTPFFGALHTAITLSTWAAWPPWTTCSLAASALCSQPRFIPFIPPFFDDTDVWNSNLSCYANPKAEPWITFRPPPNLMIWRCWKNQNVALPQSWMWPNPVLVLIPWGLVLKHPRHDYGWSVHSQAHLPLKGSLSL